MIIKDYDIEIDYVEYGLLPPTKKAVLHSYIPDFGNEKYLSQRHPAIIICPGGGYNQVSNSNEGEPIALSFLAKGIHAFVLEYSVAPTRFPGSLLELSKAVALVRLNADIYNIDPEKITVCGFSAGGHLAASLGVYWKSSFLQRFLGYEQDENKPNALLLGYPVISGEKTTVHLNSMKNLLGENPNNNEIKLFSLENNVTDLVPPTFLWHTSDDDIVDVQNSLLFASALRTNQIPFELHIYPHGDHGLGLANKITAGYLGQIVPACQNWIDMAIRFINDI